MALGNVAYKKWYMNQTLSEVLDLEWCKEKRKVHEVEHNFLILIRICDISESWQKLVINQSSFFYWECTMILNKQDSAKVIKDV